MSIKWAYQTLRPYRPLEGAPCGPVVGADDRVAIHGRRAGIMAESYSRRICRMSSSGLRRRSGTRASAAG